MKNKNILLIPIGIVLVIAAGIFSYTNFNTEIKLNEIRDSAFSIYLENKKQEFKEDTDWYEVKINYPTQNSFSSDFIFKMWNDFANEFQLKSIKNRKDAEEKLGLADISELKYSFSADYKLVEGKALTGSSTISYVYTIYTFTGGAHGSTQIVSFTQDEFGRVLSIDEILPKEKLGKVSELVYAELQKQMKNKSDDSWLKEGTTPTRENYSVAWLDGSEIVISFGQYQIASYAEGMFEVRIPISEI